MNTSVCESGELTPVDDAIERLLALAPLAPSTQQIKLDQALGRVLACDIFSPLNLLAWDNSAIAGRCRHRGPSRALPSLRPAHLVPADAYR